MKKNQIVENKAFNINLLNQSILKVKCSESQIRISVIDTILRQCNYYEIFHLENTDKNNYQENLKTFWKQHPFLQAKYWKDIQLIFNKCPINYIPEAYDDADNYTDYLKLNGFLGLNRENIYSFKHKHLNLISLTGLEDELSIFFREQIYTKTKVNFLHISSAFLENLSHFPKREQEMYMNISENLLTIVIFIDENLLFINNYDYVTLEDIIYFGNLLFQNFDLEADKVNITLWGDIKINDEQILKKYLPNFSFGRRYPHINFHSEFSFFHLYTDFDILA